MTQGNEVRLSRPLYPSPRSLELAPLPREQLSQQIPFSTILHAAAHELQNTSQAMPKKKRLSIIGIHSMNIASGNSIRTDHFQATFPGVGVHRREGIEAHSGNAFIDAKSKAITSADAYLTYRRSVKSILKRLTGQEEFFDINPFNGPDSVNDIPQANADGSFKGFVRLGKPDRETPGRELEAIQQRFQDLTNLAKDNNWPSIPYIVEQATYIRNIKRKDGQYDAHSVRRSVVFLDPAGLAYLATPEGFKVYQKEVAKSKPSLGQTAGGMKIEAFNNLGVIQAVTRDPLEAASFHFASNQQVEYDRAEKLALGKLDVSLLEEYQSKFPKTLRQRFASKKQA